MQENIDMIDDPIEWIPVKGRRRSKSPPNQNDIKEMKSSKEDTGVSLAPGFNPPPEELPTNYRPLKTNNSNNKRNQETTRNSTLQKSSQKPMVEEKKKSEDPRVKELHKTIQNSKQTKMTETKNTSNPDDTDDHFNESQFRPAPHPNIPTNDGTHRITIKWTPPEAIKEYEKDKNKLNDAIHSLVKEMFPEKTGALYRCMGK
jgi:hypothetical protein